MPFLSLSTFFSFKILNLGCQSLGSAPIGAFPKRAPFYSNTRGDAMALHDI